jgi:hypothetical protein
MEMREVERSENELIVNLTHEQRIARLTEIRRKVQELRTRERIGHAGVNKLIALGEGEKVERYRKLGVSSDLEAKKKVHNTIQKGIISYRKMGLSDEKIRNMMVNDMELDAVKVETAFKEL